MIGRLIDGASGRPLSPCERRVLVLASRGFSVGETAATLGWEPQRVRDLLRSAMLALGARSKLEAVLIALRSGEVGD